MFHISPSRLQELTEVLDERETDEKLFQGEKIGVKIVVIYKYICVIRI